MSTTRKSQICRRLLVNSGYSGKTEEGGDDVAHALLEDAEVQMTEAEILGTMERISQARLGVSAKEVLGAYRTGNLIDPGGILEVISLARLLEHSPLEA